MTALLAVLLTLPAAVRAGATVSEKNKALTFFIHKARAEKIWLRPEWRALMHLPPALLGSRQTSLVDEPRFFLSPQGKTSAQAELEATLEKLFSVTENNNKIVACRFPARLVWLRKVLDIDKNTLPDYQCSDLNNWLRKLDADSLTLIFPVSVLNSPASMFGHTFLRLDRRADKKPDLLAWTVNFAAYADQGRGLGFAFNGIFGGYPGRFTLAPYYQRVKAYSDIENRDLWEYELNYSPAEVNFMLLHLWELLPAYFDYYFIDENCSYHLLALLEVARPGLNLTQGFYWDATPADTVRAISSAPGLLKKVNYRPSLRENIKARAEALNLPEQKVAKALALGELKLHEPVFANKTENAQAAILELATNYLSYRQASSHKAQDVFDVAPDAAIAEDRRDVLANRQHRLLTARSNMAVELPEPLKAEPAFRPDQGHRSRRMGLRYGSEDSEQYSQFDFRWAYHDLYDPDGGFVDGAQLEFIAPSLRFYPEENNWQFEGIDFVDIISAPARNYFIRPFSWKASASLRRYQFDDDERPLSVDFQMAGGLSYQLANAVAVSVFVDTQLLLANEFDGSAALGFGATTQIIYTLTDKWKAGLHAELMQYVEGVTQTSYELGGRLRLSLDKDSAVLLELTENREFSRSFVKAQLSWQYYF
jgi:hypothetical protein